MYQTLSESASFHKRYDKTFWCVFQFAVLTAVHLQNANGKFHKVEYRHCSGEAESVYISVRQIYSGQCVKFYHSQSSFVDCISKNIRFTAYYLESQNAL